MSVEHASVESVLKDFKSPHVQYRPSIMARKLPRRSSVRTLSTELHDSLERKARSGDNFRTDH